MGAGSTGPEGAESEGGRAEHIQVAETPVQGPQCPLTAKVGRAAGAVITVDLTHWVTAQP